MRKWFGVTNVGPLLVLNRSLPAAICFRTRAVQNLYGVPIHYSFQWSGKSKLLLRKSHSCLMPASPCLITKPTSQNQPKTEKTNVGKTKESGGKMLMFPVFFFGFLCLPIVLHQRGMPKKMLYPGPSLHNISTAKRHQSTPKNKYKWQSNG